MTSAETQSAKTQSAEAQSAEARGAEITGIALIGCGRIGRVHARNVAAHPRARLIACHDASPAAAAAVAGETGARPSPSLDALLADPAIRAVLVAASTGTHLDLITRAARAGKAVLCEKPIDLDLARAEACWREIAPLRPLVMVGFNRRFDPTFRALHARLAAGEIGRLEQLVLISRDPAPPPPGYVAASGGLFRDMTIHDLDMARHLAGPIVEVQAMGANLIDPGIEAAGDIDAAMLVLRAASGALVHVSNSRRCAYGYDQRIEAFGAAGMLQAHNHHRTTVEAWGHGRTRAMDPVQGFFIDRYADAYRAELDHFVGCVETGAAPLTDFAAGLEALRLADAALASMTTGRAVRVEAPAD